MADFLWFRWLLTPRLLIWAWWAIAAVSLLIGWFMVLGTTGGTGMALAVWAGGILGSRILCELLLVTFAIHERLVEIRSALSVLVTMTGAAAREREREVVP